MNEENKTETDPYREQANSGQRAGDGRQELKKKKYICVKKKITKYIIQLQSSQFGNQWPYTWQNANIS